MLARWDDESPLLVAPGPRARHRLVPRHPARLRAGRTSATATSSCPPSSAPSRSAPSASTPATSTIAGSQAAEPLPGRDPHPPRRLRQPDPANAATRPASGDIDDRIVAVNRPAAENSIELLNRANRSTRSWMAPASLFREDSAPRATRSSARPGGPSCSRCSSSSSARRSSACRPAPAGDVAAARNQPR